MREERIDWPNGAKMALSIVVNVEEGSEMTVARGDRGMEPVDELGIHIKSPIRNYGNESNYLYGIKAGAPRVVKLLKATGITGGHVLLTGGLALDTGLLAAIQEEMVNEKVNLDAASHPDSIYAGAIGAALWGAFRHEKIQELQNRAAA